LAYSLSLFDLEASYLVVDASLIDYIYIPSKSITVMQYSGSIWPVNYTTNVPIPSLAWANFKNTTKIIISSFRYQHDPILYNNSLGFYIKLIDVSTSTFSFNVKFPFGMVWSYNFYYSNIIYVNPD
jgi:hypothetical protein